MRDATLVFLIKGNPISDILLGMKKTGFAQGKINGFGGKVEPGETIKQAARREVWEEVGVRVDGLEPVARLTFFFPAHPDWDQVVHVFLAQTWAGEPRESDEMRPAWYAVNAIPFQTMWQDDPHWLPRVLAGEKLAATFTFQADNESIDTQEIVEWTQHASSS